MEFEVPKTMKPMVDFAIHLVVGGLAFCVVVLVAAGIGGVVKGIEILGFKPAWFLQTADIVERVVFYLDLFVFALFLLTETIRLTVSMLKGTNHG